MQPSLKVDNLNLLKCLGKGSYGEVFLTTIDGKNGYYATKKMDKKYADQPQVSKYLKNEINILKELKHKNIVRLEDIKTTTNHYYLVMEFCNGGSLSDCLKKYMQRFGTPFTQEIVQYLMKQIVNAIQYIHSRHIIHRDLKLDNILVNFDSEIDKNNLNMMKAIVKIIDFGFATHMGKQNLVYTALGSPINMDPNILRKMTDKKGGIEKMIGYDQKADIWSLGTLCYEMIIGKAAFNCKSMEELVQKVESGNYAIPTTLSKELVSFLNAMLQYNAQKRLSASELARHHFLTKNVRDFEPIDVRKVSNKVTHNKLNINIKKNNTIWSIFNEEDENKLINIPANYLMPMDSPINEDDEYNKPPCPQIPMPDMNKNYPQDNFRRPETAKRNNLKNQGYGTGYNNEINPYNNNNYQGGYGYGNCPPPYMTPNMAPHFPYQMPMMGPHSAPLMGPSPRGQMMGPDPRGQMMGPGPRGPMMGPDPRGQMMGPGPMMGPLSGPFIGRADPLPMGNQMNWGRLGGPIMQIPTFGVPSPGEDPNAINGYGFSSGIYANEFNNRGQGYGFGYGYGYGGY